jgi:hypothetical protein
LRRNDTADARCFHAGASRCALDRRTQLCRRGEAQLVVVAACKQRKMTRFAIAAQAHCARCGQAVKFDLGAHARALADVAQIGDEPVGYVDGAARYAA